MVPDFYFLSQENAILVAITPFSNMFMDNIQKLDEKYDILSNSIIYILDNSTFMKYELLFNISGTIDILQPKSE